MAENTAKKQRGKPFPPGKSGNPAGRPPGARNKATMAALRLLEGEVAALTRTAIDAALRGDMTALKLCLERLIPPCRERPVKINLPEVKDAGDLPQITQAILHAVGSGELCPNEAATVVKLVEAHRGALEMADITLRIEKLESMVKK